MKVILLLLSSFTVVASICFKEQFAATRRLPVIPPSKVIDYFECKIRCAMVPWCEAFVYNDKLAVCAMLKGPSTTLQCTESVKEWLKITDDELCPIIEPAAISQMYKRDERLPKGTAFADTVPNTAFKTNTVPPCGAGNKLMDLYLPDGRRRNGQNDYTTNIAWDDRLATWIYSMNNVGQTYIRAAKCYETAVDELAVNGACSPLKNSYEGGGVFGPPRADQTPACPPGASWVRYMMLRDNQIERVAADEFYLYTKCIFGEWFFIGPLNGVTQTMRVIAASCVNF